MVETPVQVQLVGFGVVGVPFEGCLLSFTQELHLDLSQNRQGNLILNIENILQLPVVSLRPQMIASRRFDQLRCDPQPLARFAHAAFQDMSHAELFPHQPKVLVLILKLKRRAAPGHIQVGYVAQYVDDFFGDAVAEILLPGVAAHVDERQHRDRHALGYFRRGFGLLGGSRSG